MCKYVQENMCSVTNSVCPWMYRCPQDGLWKPNNYMPQDCPQAINADVPHGYYRVRMTKNNWLYVDLGDRTIKVKNTLSYVPNYVKLIKRKTGYVVKKEGKENEGT